MAHELSTAEIQDLLGRNPYLGDAISAGISTGAIDFKAGYSFTDSKFGNVLISTDVSDHFRYIADSPISPDLINAPPYESPAPGFFSVSDWLQGLQKSQQVLKWILVLIVVGYGLFVLAEAKRVTA